MPITEARAHGSRAPLARHAFIYRIIIGEREVRGNTAHFRLTAGVMLPGD